MAAFGTAGIRLDEDWHVHSTFSDGADTLAANIDAARSRGLRHLGCVDHVRRDSTYLAEYVAAISAVRDSVPMTLSIGVEAKILDAGGRLDLPVKLKGVEVVYIADHQFPDTDGPVSPRVMRESIAAKERDGARVLDELAAATIGAMRQNESRRRQLVLAHLFSIVPKLGLSENQIADSTLRAIAHCAADSGTIVEVSERWRCPSPRMLRICRSYGVRIVASTDSHRAADIAAYDYVRSMVAEAA